ncbi:hypothetical protein OG372_11795 [Streptomyces sp. NBC_01020]|uniref:hypothetical protein n=1 Tax=unclassified Streptomyces TaxID=2593676 RepID=UPI003864AA55|nr:hypothetical protein OG372_11795 [Streptomyces sp. NBC_01020]WSX42274.1 hypothetical protein OG760_11480 [Streptomyces sp. NBC_00963]
MTMKRRLANTLPPAAVGARIARRASQYSATTEKRRYGNEPILPGWTSATTEIR